MLNQAEVIEALRMVEVASWPKGVMVSEAVMEEMTWSEQLSIVAQSDVLIGMHGAGNPLLIVDYSEEPKPTHTERARTTQ